MAREEIRVGQYPNDGTGDNIRTVYEKINRMTEELYAMGAGVNHWRGEWAGTDALPTTGGTYTGGVPGAGDEWTLTETLTIGDNTYASGTIIKALVNTPGQTLTNWAFLAIQL